MSRRRVQRRRGDRLPDVWRKCEVCLGHGQLDTGAVGRAPSPCTACDGGGEVLEDRADRLPGAA